MEPTMNGAAEAPSWLLHQARFSDLDEFAGALRHDDVELVRLGRSGDLNGIDLILLPDLLVRIGHQATGWDCIARSPDGALSLVLAWGYHDHARIYGREVVDGTFSLSGPGTEFVSSVRGKGNYLFLPIPASLLDERMLGDVRGDVLNPGFKQVGQATPAALAMLLNTLEMMQRAAANPSISKDERLRRNLQNALMNALHYVITPELARAKEVPRNFVQRMRLFRKVMDVLHAPATQANGVADLCKELHVPESVLRTIFQEFTGLDPAEFIRRLRWQRMQRAWRNTAGTVQDLHDAALDAGFCDPARVRSHLAMANGPTTGPLYLS